MLTSNAAVIRRSVLVGLVAALVLLAFYFLLVGLTSRSWEHSLELLIQDRYYVTAIAAGFGVQLGLFSYVFGKMEVQKTATKNT
ncbi:MAG: hypothetical protein D9V47_02460 [Clostridia bacterium]|nr:MAG: hypothetical protein D9V47_02460 [Clostridia bacterium]